MLVSLNIKNLALVSEIEINPSANFNTITGETGAGKSLIIGALKLLAGWRTASDIIRKGAKSCEASGQFLITNPALCEAINLKLDEIGAPLCEDGQLLLKRVVSENGSRAFANGSAITIAALKELGDMLIDIHGPHDNQLLLQPAIQLSLIDDFAGLAPQREACSKIWHELQAAEKELKNLGESTLTAEEMELLEHQLKEIQHANLNENEETALVEQYRICSNGQRLMELANAIADCLDRNDNSITSRLGGIVRMGREISEIDHVNGQKFTEALEQMYEMLQDLAADVENYRETIDIDQQKLQLLEERLDLIQRLKRKYGHSISDVLAAETRIKARLETSANFADSRQALEEKILDCKNRHRLICEKLHDKRTAAAQKLAMAIEAKLMELGFEKAKFRIALTPSQPEQFGSDAAEYQFAPNLGEETHSLRKIASSGEIARVMLAIRTVLSTVDYVPILVFDEIDANIGGRVAGAVASELHEIGQHHQVFSITHLPLIAAAGESHFVVAKHTDSERTYTEIQPVEGEARIDEIVRMLGDSINSASARTHAKTLLANAASNTVKMPKTSSKAKKSAERKSSQPGLFISIILLFLALVTGCNYNDDSSPLILAHKALLEQDYDMAKQQASIYLRINPESIDALAIRAISMLNENDYTSWKRSLPDLEKATGLAPKRTDLQYLLAYALYKNRQFAAAIPILQKLRTDHSLNNAKRRTNILVMLGEIGLINNQLQLGNSALQPLQANPNFKSRPELYNCLAILALKNNDPQQAITLLNTGLQFNPHNEILLQNHAVINDLYLGQVEQAKKSYLACANQKTLRNDNAGTLRIQKRLRTLAERSIPQKRGKNAKKR